MTNILVVVDPGESAHITLDRCTVRAPDSDLRIHVVLFIEHESAATFSASYAERTAWLQEQIAPYVEGGYQITSEVIPFTQLYQAIIEAADAFRPDFVLKPIRRHSLFQSALRTTTDWNLIRNCQYPLLLVSELERIEGKAVLAALDVVNVDEKHVALNQMIARQSDRLAELLGGSTHAVSAWQRHTPMMMSNGVDATAYVAPEAVRRDHVSALKKLGQYPIENIHLEEGPPSLVVSNAAEKIDAGVIVIGTVARKGLSGALVGNTAEGVLESTHCDILVISAPEDVEG